jgi:hypothetical protein
MENTHSMSQLHTTTLAGLALSLVLLAGCASTPTSGVEPGDGPAAEPGSSQTFEEPMDEEPTEEPTDEFTEEPVEEEEPEPEVATFKDKYTYEDGVEVEITKIQHGKVTRADAEYSDDLEGGEDWVLLTARVKNGSSKRLDAYGSFTLTYGEDGDEAESTCCIDSAPDTTDMSGKILPGRSKVASELFLLPKKHQGDVVLEFSLDFEHEDAIFAGSVK